MSKRKPLRIDLSEATGTNTTPLEIKTKDGRLLRFAIPERDDETRARMLAQVQACANDDQARELVADWLLACSTNAATRADTLAIVRGPAALSQVLTVLLTGRLPDPKQMDQLLARLLDKMTGKLIEAI